MSVSFSLNLRMDGLNLTSGSNEPKNPALGIRVFDNNKQIFPAPGKQWGWLFAKVPSIHPFEHPKYGITLKKGSRKGNARLNLLERTDNKLNSSMRP